jgi:hypothetical protein
VDEVREYLYDGGQENTGRLPWLILAILGCFLSFMAGYAMINGIRLVNSRAGAIVLVMLLSGPVLLSIYLSHLLRHYQYKSTRILVDAHGVTILTAGRERRIERKDLDYVHHTGSMLEFRLRNQDPILLPARFTDQDDLLARLS